MKLTAIVILIYFCLNGWCFMYKIGIVVNENEMAHSAFANTPKLLSELSYVKQQKNEYYRFYVFDKFNIKDLFQKSNKNFIMSFDSLFVATNATNNIEIYEAFVSNKNLIADFISAEKGVFISSQKKLSIKEGDCFKTIGFLPEKYDYAICDRPEKSSADGKISVVGKDSIVLNYPTVITENDIEYHCLHNNFINHKYRSFLIPSHESQYQLLLSDNTSAKIPDILRDSVDKTRKILLVSGSQKERVVITTMALDWAEHLKLIENILIYITEGVPNFAFVTKKNDHDDYVINSYVLRAKVWKIAFREYDDIDIGEIAKLPHDILVLSPSYEKSEIDRLIDITKNENRNISIYWLSSTQSITECFILYHYTNETSIDQIKIEVNNWIFRRFYPNLWGKSVWTYAYCICMMKTLGIDFISLVPVIYEELSLHFCKKGIIDGSYDNVINASCKLLEILSVIIEYSVELDDEIFRKFPIDALKAKVEQWLVEKIYDDNNSEYDKLYILVSLYKTGYMNCIETDKMNEINNKANEVIRIHQTKGFVNYSNIILCQILYLVKELFIIGFLPEDFSFKICEEIITELKLRQSDTGVWRNISETAEVSIYLLELEMGGENKLFPINILNENVIKAISFLYQNYDNDKYCWYEDVNTSVKAVHAIGLYDKVKNFSANDFFYDISIQSTRLEYEKYIERENKAVLDYVDVIYEKEKEIRVLKRASEKKKLFQCLFFGAFTIALSLGIMMILMIAGLSNEIVEYNGVKVSALSRLFNEWQTEFIFGFIGVLFGAAFTGIYSFVKRKTFK